MAPQIDLPRICRQLASNNFFVGILQLCLTCAAKQDTHGVALHWYNNNEPAEDIEGYDAYVKRYVGTGPVVLQLATSWFFASRI